MKTSGNNCLITNSVHNVTVMLLHTWLVCHGLGCGRGPLFKTLLIIVPLMLLILVIFVVSMRSMEKILWTCWMVSFPLFCWILVTTVSLLQGML